MILLLSPVIFEGLVAFILLTESVNESEDGLEDFQQCQYQEVANLPKMSLD